MTITVTLIRFGNDGKPAGLDEAEVESYDIGLSGDLSYQTDAGGVLRSYVLSPRTWVKVETK